MPKYVLKIKELKIMEPIELPEDIILLKTRSNLDTLTTKLFYLEKVKKT